MIAFGCSVAESEAYRRYAGPGIQRVSEPDSEVFAFASVGSVFRSYNLLIDAVADRGDLEAFVLVHPHGEIVDPDFCAKVREVLRDPDVAVVGCAGATEVESIAWWEGSMVAAPIVQRYQEHGGGELPAFSWTHAAAPPAEVEVVDGFLLVLSPWAVRNVRFDETLGLGHGFDFDYCRQVRAAGRKVVAADLRAVYYRSLELISDLDLWVDSHMKVAEKWDDSIPDDDPNSVAWKERARRAEAEREAARAIAYGYALGTDARVLELERAVEEVTETLSWRVTEPLRQVNHWRNERRS
jgi:Glycosyltransferase like family